MARKTNVTGIKGLSIGSTKNDRGYLLARYLVNFKSEGKYKSKSFYFGKNLTQREAFNKACEYMMEIGLLADDFECDGVYLDFKHENLLG